MEAHQLALEGRRRRAAGQSAQTRAEVARLIAVNQYILEAALDRTPFVPSDDSWTVIGVVTREEAAMMHGAARNGLNIDFIPLNARTRQPRDTGAA